MSSRIVIIALVALTLGSFSTSAQTGGTPNQPLPPGQTNNPFPQPIAAKEGAITVTIREFASLPNRWCRCADDDPGRGA